MIYSMPPGSRLGRYRILEELGRGGMAVVFRAHDPSLDREVAIKVLPSYHTEDPTFQERFTREAQAVAQLNHPNILQVYDFGEDKGFTYIVTEYVPGGTLEDKFHGEPLSEEETLKFMRPLGEALDYAHSQGILHRDLKPSNVLLDAQSRPILGDFGLARLLETSSRSTQAQQVLGTPVYMSPEQALGGDVDHRSDLYAFGVMLYEMLVGRTPFRGDSLTAMLMAHVHEPVPLPTSLNPDFDRGLEAVLLQALAKNPGDRHQSAAEMVEALERSVGNVPVEDIQAAAQATMVRTVKPSTGVAPSRRRWVLAGVGVGLAVAVGVAVVAISQLGGDDEPAGATAAEAQPEATAVTAVTAGTAVIAGTATPALSLAEAVAFLEETQVRIAEGVTTLRQLVPQQDIDVKLRTRAQLAELAEGYFRRQYVRDQVFGTEELYKTLGLIQEEDNLQQVIEGILLQQVVALFDDEGEVLYVPSDAAAFGAVEELGYASAYMAGLQQQLFNVSELRRQAREEGNFDQYRAVTAFMGGEVSVIREGFISTFFSEEKVAELNRPLPDNLLESAPAVVRKAALFPQVEGHDFVASIFVSENSWEAVNSVYSKPPVSTEQILHPDKYLAGEEPLVPTIPDLASALGKGWDLLSLDTMGEFLLRTYLEEFLDPDTAAAAAAGWGGDRYALLTDPEAGRIFVLLTVWDSAADSIEFFEAFEVFAENKTGVNANIPGEGVTQRLWVAPEETIALSQAETSTLLIIGDDESAVQQVLSLATGP